MIKKTLLFIMLLVVGACSNNKDGQIIKKGATGSSDGTASQSQIKTQVGNALTKEQETSALHRSPQKVADSDYRSDSLAVFFKNQYEVEYYKRGTDTLEIVSGSDFLYYPFGHCREIICLKSSLPKFNFRSEKDAVDKEEILQRGTYGNSFIKLAYDADKKQLQIVTGKIIDPGVTLANGVSIGMPIEQFLMTFLRSPSFLSGRQFKVIRLTSVVNGIRHFYNVDGSTLKSIQFETDYYYSKT